ncbi:MAG: hypothetical protein PUA47_08540, partial [Bacteroidales bacterium]|nr:hypothetical protein [Bacteroidales bacterium]
MKIRFFILAITVCTAVSCGNTALLADRYGDDIYSTADKVDSEALKAERDATDSLIQRTKTALDLLDEEENALRSTASAGSDTDSSAEPGVTVINIPENASVNFYDAWAFGDPWYPYGYRNPWYYSSWYYNPWYYDHWYYNPWYYSSWYYNPWYYDHWYYSGFYGNPWYCDPWFCGGWY